MPRKKKNTASLRLHMLSIFIGFFITLGFLYYVYPYHNFSVEAAPIYNLQIVTPREQIRNGGEVQFSINMAQYKAGEEMEVGVKYDGRKLRLDSVEGGEVGQVAWNEIPSAEGEKRFVITANPLGQTYDAEVRFALVRFTITDTTGETNSDGRGFTELCTLFNPDTVQPTDPVENPTQDPVVQPTSVPTENSDSDIPPPQGGQVVTPTYPPQPTRLPTQNFDQLCVPLNVRGSSGDKLDIVVIPAHFSPEQYDIFLQYAQAAVDDLIKTNLTDYDEEIVNKMNWYAFNNTVYNNRTLSFDEAFYDIGMNQKPCAADRFLVIEHSSPEEVEGWAFLYVGGMVTTGALQVYNPIAAHEWGHFVGGFNDEYDEGGESEELPNCTYDGGSLSSRQDPCPEDQPLCPDDQMPAENRIACPKWDCNQRECTPLEQLMYQDVGCYPRCYNSDGFRPRPKSIMDTQTIGAPDNFVFHGPALVHLIQEVFANYR